MIVFFIHMQKVRCTPNYGEYRSFLVNHFSQVFISLIKQMFFYINSNFSKNFTKVNKMDGRLEWIWIKCIRVYFGLSYFVNRKHKISERPWPLTKIYVCRAVGTRGQEGVIAPTYSGRSVNPLFPNGKTNYAHHNSTCLLDF